MMRRIISVWLAVGLLAVWAGMAQAAERPETLKAFGGIHRGRDSSGADGVQNVKLITGSAQVITGVQINAGGTACTVSLYDAASVSGSTRANGFFENSAAANTGETVILSTPIRTTSGIVLVSDGNEDGVVIFTEQATP